VSARPGPPEAPELSGSRRDRLAEHWGVRAIARMAWPAALSYVLNNTYRINDQFWFQGLGAEAQAAIGATFFVQVMNFAFVFLAVGGTLALVARATGAQEPGERDSIVRHALLFGLVLGVTLCLSVRPAVPAIVSLLGVRGEAVPLAETYLGTIYLFMVPLVLFPVTDAIFIGRGNTRVPMCLQCIAVAMNYVLNPILIYGPRAAEFVDAPGAALFGRVAEALSIEGRGIAGGAIATGISRSTTVLIGIAILHLAYGTSLTGSLRPNPKRIAAIARISIPSSLSIAVYSGAYWALLGLVIVELGTEVTAGLGLGFQVFEGVAFPCYLGVSIAGSSLVGRAIGAQDREAAWCVVRSTRKLARGLGLAFALLFFFGGAALAPLFTQDAAVERTTATYVAVLAFSQLWVAIEAANEKVLLGSGHTRPILWISPLGNLLRVPIAWLFALVLGYGAVGVWWAINVTTYLKAWLFWRNVQRGAWLEHSLADARREAEERRTRGGLVPSPRSVAR